MESRADDAEQMVNVGRVGSAGPALGGPRRATADGFSVTVPQGATVAGPAAASPAAALDGMLALQEAQGEAVRDREARRHGQALLEALAQLQHALLGGDDATALHDVAALVEEMPLAATPALAAALAAIALRARIELARRAL